MMSTADAAAPGEDAPQDDTPQQDAQADRPDALTAETTVTEPDGAAPIYESVVAELGDPGTPPA